MNEQLIDVRTPLAASEHVRIELGRDGVLHVLAGPITLHMDRGRCEELTTTLARAMLALAALFPKNARPTLSVVRSEEEPEAPEAAAAD